MCRAAETSKSVSLSAGLKGIVASHFLPKMDDDSSTVTRSRGSRESIIESLASKKAS